MANFEISWQAPEYEFREKGTSWYWLSIIVAAIIIAFSVWTKNFLFGLFVVIAEILFIVWGSRPPRTIDFTINEVGITVGGTKHYSLKDFENMSVDTFSDGWAELIFVFHARFKTPLKVLFPQARLEELRLDLKPIVKEVPYEPTLLDAIEKLLRF